MFPGVFFPFAQNGLDIAVSGLHSVVERRQISLIDNLFVPLVFPVSIKRIDKLCALSQERSNDIAVYRPGQCKAR